MNTCTTPCSPCAAPEAPATPPGVEGIDFRVLFEHGPDAVLCLDAEGRITEANAALHAGFGHEPRAVRGHLLSTLLPDCDADDLLADLARRAQPLDTTLRLGDGRRREVTATVIATAAPGGGFFLILRDRRPAWLLQRRLRVQAEILARSRDAVVALDAAGTVQCWNAAAERLYGHDKRVMAGQRFDRLFDPALRGRLADALAAASADVSVPIALTLTEGPARGRTVQLVLSRLPGVEPGEELWLVLGERVDGVPGEAPGRERAWAAAAAQAEAST